MFQQPYLGKVVIYHSLDLGPSVLRPGNDYAAVVTCVQPFRVLEGHARADECAQRPMCDLAVLTGDSQEPVRQINGVKYGTEGGTYGWTDAAR